MELLYGRDFATLATVTGTYVVNQPTCGNQPAMTCTSRFVLLPGASPRYVTTSFVRRWHVGVHPWEGLNRSGPPQPCASSLHPLNDLDAVGYALLIGRRNPKRHTQVFPVAGGCNRIYGKYGSTFRFTGVVTVQGVW